MSLHESLLIMALTSCIPLILGDCGGVHAPTNGRRFVSGTTVGHRVNYTCNPGYNLLGNSSRTCQRNGQWSGTPPSCSRKLCTCNTFFITCTQLCVCKCMQTVVFVELMHNYFGRLAVLRAIRQYFICHNFTVCCYQYLQS